jgi:thioredoxin 1
MDITSIQVAPVLVVCLCAEWCNVCCDYKSRFAQVRQSVQANHPQVQFLWIDVEDDADLLHPLDVENFPTLLLAAGNAPHFFGPVTPQVHTLERMVHRMINDAGQPTLTDPAVVALVARIRLDKELP